MSIKNRETKIFIDGTPLPAFAFELFSEPEYLAFQDINDTVIIQGARYMAIDSPEPMPPAQSTHAIRIEFPDGRVFECLGTVRKLTGNPPTG